MLSIKNNKTTASWQNKKMKYILFEIANMVPLAIWGWVCACYVDSVVSDSLWPHGHCSLLGSSVHGILQVRILQWVAIPFSRGSSWPRDWTHVSHVSCIGRWVPYHWATREAPSAFSQPCVGGCWGSRDGQRTKRYLSVWICTGQ